MKKNALYFKNKIFNAIIAHKNILMIAAVFLFAMTSSFAEGLGIFDDVGNKLLGILVSPGLKAALALMLAGCFGGIAFGKLKGQDGIVGVLLPVAFGIAGILGAVSIISWIFSGIDSSKLKFQ
ncbi:MAG: hypothetical protein K6E78_09960 [Treponema sp.]|nr:hypothetical protein [Treponema sp.]